jgi:hypothetical protein
MADLNGDLNRRNTSWFREARSRTGVDLQEGVPYSRRSDRAQPRTFASSARSHQKDERVFS